MKIVREGLGSVMEVNTKKAYNDLVTQYDPKCEATIVSLIKQEFPGHMFIGEESTTIAVLGNEPTWIIDPIDGTNNFIRGFPEIAVSVGLTINKDVKVGAMNIPVSDDVYTAVKGRGAFENGKKIVTSKCSDISKSLVCSHYKQADDTFLGRLEGIVTKTEGMLGSAVCGLIYVAKGNLDVMVQEGLECWDMAAGSLLVTEAGGVVISTDGKPFDVMEKKIVAASSQTLADNIVKLVQDADKKLSLQQ